MSSFKDEFKLKNFGFGYDKPYKFSLSEWRGPHGLFVAWRVFWCLWHLAWIVVSVESQVSDEEYGGKWFIYLTNWSYVTLTIQTVVALAVTVNSTCKGRKTVGDFNQGESETLSGSVNSTSWLEKMMWFFTAVSFNGAIIVTIVYWGFIFKEFTHVLNIVTHAVTTFYVICDLFISASPTRLLHFIYPCAFGAVYGLFTLFYHLGDGTNNKGEPYVYSLIDWSSVGSAAGVILGLIFVATPVVHLFVFGMHTLRMFLSQRCACGKQSGKEGDDMQMA